MKLKRSFFCAALCLILAGCGSSDTQEVRPFESGDLDTLLQSGIFSEKLEVVDSGLVCALYGLSFGESVTACEGYLSTGATAEELVLFTAADESAAESVRAACELRVEDQILGYEDYIPGEVAKLEKAVIAVRGNTVLLVVANDGDAAAGLVEGME